MIAEGVLETETLRPLMRAEFMRLVDLGVFDEDEKIELLWGVMVKMSPQGKRHSVAILKLNMLLAPRLVGRAAVGVQLPFAASDDSQPEPDLAVVDAHPPEDDHPGKAFLVIEVADSSLRRDRLKARLYAAAGVPEYWIVNVADGWVDVHRSPEGNTYRQVTRVERDGVLALQAFPDVTFAVAEVL